MWIGGVAPLFLTFAVDLVSGKLHAATDLPSGTNND